MADSLVSNQDILTHGIESARIVRFREGAVRWESREDWRARLRGDRSPDWFALEDAVGLVVVKTGRDRTTWRCALPGGFVYAKVAEYASLLSRLKAGFFGDALSREWRSSLRAEARGIPVVRCLALGVHGRRHPRVVLLSEGAHSAEGLLDAWRQHVERVEPRQRRPLVRCLIGAVSRLFALSHDRGFVHGDAHPNNILIRWVQRQQPEALFLDVSTARLRRHAVSMRQSVQSLAQLDQYFHRCATRTDRLRFLLTYLAQRAFLPASWTSPSGRRRLLEKLRQASVRHAERLARTRDRRLRRNGPYFARLELQDRWRVTVALRLERRHVFPEPNVPDRSAADWRAILGPLIANLSTTRARRIALEHARQEIEWVRIRRPWTKVGWALPTLLSAVSGSRHRRAFERCHKQRHRDVHNELILGYGEHSRGGLLDVTFLIRSLPEVGDDRKDGPV